MGPARTTETPLVVYGINAVRELLRSRIDVLQLKLGSGPREGELRAAAALRGVPAGAAARSELDRLAATPHHQGAVALVPPFEYAPLDRVVAAPCPSALLLDGVVDPRNLGAILRTARAAGVGGVVLPQDRSAPITPVVVAASAGLVFDLAICRVTNLVRSMEHLKGHGYWLVGLVPRGEPSLYEVDVPQRPAIVVGGEDRGLRPLVRRACDLRACLPMAPGVDSLNVAVATGAALYEILVRRGPRTASP